MSDLPTANAWRSRVRAAAELPDAERYEVYEAALRAFPNEAEFLAYVVSSVLEDDPGRARALAVEALSADIEDPEVAYALAESLFFLEEYEHAERALRMSLPASSDAPTADLGGRVMFMFGRLMGLKGDVERMLAALDVAVQYEPDNAIYVLSHAAMLTELDRVPEALAVLAEGLKHSPGDTSLREELKRLRGI